MDEYRNILVYMGDIYIYRYKYNTVYWAGLEVMGIPVSMSTQILVSKYK